MGVFVSAYSSNFLLFLSSSISTIIFDQIVDLGFLLSWWRIGRAPSLPGAHAALCYCLALMHPFLPKSTQIPELHGPYSLWKTLLFID